MNVICLTAGGTARELSELVSLDDSFQLLGSLDDNLNLPQVIGPLSDWHKWLKPNYRFLNSTGSFRTMLWRRELLRSMPADSFISYLDPKSTLYPSARLGQAAIIFPNTVLAANVKLSDWNFVYHNSVISHDCQIESFSIIANQVTLSGDVKVGENSYIGSGATILEGRHIGHNCIVAAGSTVTKDVPDNSIYISSNRIEPNKYL